ncbi:unnamed protein product [Bursaphelenchus xylophilus]|uniref:(pine wood nematode) hypothetical protein n=1 Tax=Bursaphelenchus xylophilus TaxID=6326 RepID=A0A1I7SUT2_BURXY|nr:unnamed protein product [Bursaphelenchus xylophilus]CAG9125891.1 unnamed protein product [Bursaphelenchus xylophilus]
MFLQAYHSNHLIASAVGVVLNTYLMVVISQCTRQATKQVNVILMASTINDLLFSLFELILQHVIYQSDGVMYVLSFGFDKNVGPTLRLVLAYAHYHVLIQVLIMQTAVHCYRYKIISQPRPPASAEFYRVFLLCSIPNTYLSLSFIVALHSGLKKDITEATKNLPQAWKNSDGTNDVIAVVSWTDPQTKFYVLNNLLVVSAMTAVCVYYIYKCYMSVNNTDCLKLSLTTMRMRNQFNRCLIAQTAVIAVLKLVPSLMFSSTFALRLRGVYLGTPTMIGHVWFGAINALIPLLYIDGFRKFTVRLRYERPLRLREYAKRGKR